MKKAGYLLLLTPALFLASCQTTPKIDTIDENAAIAFITENFKTDAKDFVAPNNETKIRWNITNNEEQAKKEIGRYIFSASEFTFPEGKECKISDCDPNRLGKYIEELKTETTDFYKLGEDAIIGMNMKIYTKLRTSTPSNDVEPYTLKYKKSGGGLAIISESTKFVNKYTREHYYDKNGRETKFVVTKSLDEVAYTMTIEFKYDQKN